MYESKGDNEELIYDKINIDSINTIEKLMKLSARYNDNPVSFMHPLSLMPSVTLLRYFNLKRLGHLLHYFCSNSPLSQSSSISLFFSFFFPFIPPHH